MGSLNGLRLGCKLHRNRPRTGNVDATVQAGLVYNTAPFFVSFRMSDPTTEQDYHLGCRELTASAGLRLPPRQLSTSTTVASTTSDTSKTTTKMQRMLTRLDSNGAGKQKKSFAPHPLFFT